MSANLKIPLYKTLDKRGSNYYIGKLAGPFNINCKDGVVFLIFIAEDGSEELQIAPMDNKNDNR